MVFVLVQSLRYSPSNIDVIEWLGAYYIDTQFCEKAVQYFERATLIHIDNLSSRFMRTQVKWQCMVTSCYRRNGLCFLVRLCTDMGLKEVQDYATKLKKVENMKEIRDQTVGTAAMAPAPRLSAKMKALPGTNEPYEVSSQ
ncbi:interleukin-17D isoform X2 [Salmo salar]|uniref:Interleukin-17D isoform X2 n=1 Tax=Salmo salar TaxID=8030 RepID=A0A1S3NXT7_SALSA|nr:interleukin-17D isoform X2 [Salmo salar]|eukprot:XP_014020194.1 PREDICTED: interleukin-17D isoform X2 [Salmo salar]